MMGLADCCSLLLSKNLPMKILSNNQKRGFTLLELLFVIAIIAILSTLSLAMIASAQREARYSATESRLTHIQAIMSLFIEDLEFRKLPMSTSDLEAFVVANPIAGVPTLAQVKNLRYRILADYMNTEMPRDCATLSNDPSAMFPSDSFRNWLTTNYGNTALVPSLGVAVSLADFLSDATKRPALVDRWGAVASADFDNQGELLYELLNTMEYEGESGLASLGNGAIGDSDADGLPEVVDVWGEPLQFAIVQVKAVDNGADQWLDQTNEAGTTQTFSPTYYPVQPVYPVNHLGWDYLDPSIPRRFEQIRFDIWSNNVARRVEF